MSESSDPSPPKRTGALLDLHRKTVESSTGMSSAVLLGSSFALAMGLFAWLGHRWDEKQGSAPWGVLAGVGLGFLYGGYEVWKITRVASKPEKTVSEESTQQDAS